MKKLLSLLLVLAMLLSLCACTAEENVTATLEETRAEEKKTEDKSDVVVTFAKDSREAPKSLLDDPALRKYLNI